jgi:hypothetical protein
MVRDELDSLCDYIESPAANETKASRKSAPVSMKVLRVVVLTVVEKTAARPSTQDAKLAMLEAKLNALEAKGVRLVA